MKAVDARCAVRAAMARGRCSRRGRRSSERAGQTLPELQMELAAVAGRSQSACHTGRFTPRAGASHLAGTSTGGRSRLRATDPRSPRARTSAVCDPPDSGRCPRAGLGLATTFGRSHRALDEARALASGARTPSCPFRTAGCARVRLRTRRRPSRRLRTGAGCPRPRFPGSRETLFAPVPDPEDALVPVPGVSGAARGTSPVPGAYGLHAARRNRSRSSRPPAARPRAEKPKYSSGIAISACSQRSLPPMGMIPNSVGVNSPSTTSTA